MTTVKQLLFALFAVLLFTSRSDAISIPVGQLNQLSVLATCNTYVEVGDAGDRFNPQSIVGSNICQITGDIGGLVNGIVDEFDAFKFFFAGGPIEFMGTVFLPTNVGTVPIPLPLAVFQPNDPVIPITPNSSGTGFIIFNNLSAGNYIIEGMFLADPPFTIGMLNPATGQPQVIGAPISVPEPGSVLLLLAGLAFLRVWRRPRR